MVSIEVFNRREQKYMLDDDTYSKITQYIDKYMDADSYSRDGGFYSICNIYYDTEDDYLIRKSVSKPVYKEKLRLRAYGVPNGDSRSFVEIKKKYKGIVNKRRTAMRLEDAYSYMKNDKKPDGDGINRQVLKEIDYMKSFYHLKPKVYISYDRRAYFDKMDDSFRITFDTNIRTRRKNLRLEDGMYGEPILKPGMWLMEVKISGAVPRWFTEILSELKIYPVSFSKYGEEYQKYIKGAKKNV